MCTYLEKVDRLLAETPGYTNSQAALRVETLGGFRVWRGTVEIEPADWGRDKAIQLFQFLLTSAGQYLHKEQIIDRLWPELDAERGDRDFKVALNSLNRALEPDREPRATPRFVGRNGLAYGLELREVWLDIMAFDLLVAAGNQARAEAVENETLDAGTLAGPLTRTVDCYSMAVQLYHGDYLPARQYEDWTSAVRERIQVLALGAMTSLAELLLGHNSWESLRLTQRILSMDPVWEDAYRIQMRAFAALGNRPMALRSYETCVRVLKDEFGVPPLPETEELMQEIRRMGL